MHYSIFELPSGTNPQDYCDFPTIHFYFD